MIRATGSFFDGASAERREVEVRLAEDGLRIAEAAGGARELALWGYDELRSVDEEASEGRQRLRVRNGTGRLVIEDGAFLAALSRRAPRLASRDPRRSHLGLRWAGLLAGSILLLVGTLWYGLPRVADQVTRFVPHEWEVAFGERLLEPTVRTLALLERSQRPAFCTAPRGRSALDELTRRLSPVDSPYPFRVRVVDLEMINAFALPGGEIVIADGLLQFAATADEVAGVLAHEMGHVLHRHATTSIIEAVGLALLFATMLGDVGSGVIGGAGETLIGLSFRREAEAEADERAFELLERAGLSRRGMASFFARIERESGDLPAALRLLSSHPPNELRQRRAAEDVAPAAPALDKDEWRGLETICNRSEPLDTR